MGEETRRRANDIIDSVEEGKEPEEREEREIEKLLKAVRVTRANRINASNRLLSQETFVQAINIYYSCMAAIVTVLSLIYKEGSYGIASAMLTVILAISIVYLNAQKYGGRAQQLQTNYITLQQLEYEIQADITAGREERLGELQERYIKLLQTSENHIHYDHLLTLYRRDQIKKRGKGNRRLKGVERLQFWTIVIRRQAFRLILWAMPIVYFCLELTGVI